MVATIHEVARNSSQTSDQVRNASQLCQTAMQNIQSTETKVMDLSDEVNNSAAATDLLAEKNRTNWFGDEWNSRGGGTN